MGGTFMNSGFTFVSTKYRVACICDALALPAFFVIWIRPYLPPEGIDAAAHASQHAGLIVSAVMMFLLARSMVRLERAIRTPWDYRFDLARILRFFVLAPLMALGAMFLLR